MGEHRHTRKGDESLCIRAFTKEILILIDYMLSACWLQLMGVLGPYVIRLEGVEQVLIITNNITTFGYTYANCRLKKPHVIFCKMSHTGWIIAWIPPKLAWTLELLGTDQSLLRPILPTTFSRTNNQYGPNKFDTSTWYTLWDSGCNHFINPYFEIYTKYKPPEKGCVIEVNGIGGLINPKGIGTEALDLKDDTGKIHNNIFEQDY